MTKKTFCETLNELGSKSGKSKSFDGVESRYIAHHVASSARITKDEALSLASLAESEGALHADSIKAIRTYAARKSL